MSGYPSLSSIPPIPVKPKFQGETRILSLDFTLELAPGETISTISGFVASVIQGEDATPQTIISGSASYIGNVVSQMITGGVSGTQYLISSTITTSFGETIEGKVSLWVV